MPPRLMSECICSDLDGSLASAMADALDGLSACMFLVDAGGYIVHANLAGRAALAEGDVLRSLAGRLAARKAEFDQSLRDAFAAARSCNAAISVRRGIAVPLTARDGTRHMAHVLPLTSGERRRAGATYAAAAAVFVSEAVLDAQSLAEIIAKTYKLTPTELRILLAIVDAGVVSEVAKALGVAESTVRTHLRHLFQKTATTRQADLVRVVAGFSNPLVG